MIADFNFKYHKERKALYLIQSFLSREKRFYFLNLFNTATNTDPTCT